MKHGLVTDERDMGQMEITGDTKIFITRGPAPVADRDPGPVNLSRGHIRTQLVDQKIMKKTSLND